MLTWIFAATILVQSLPTEAPGALNPGVTQANIHETICMPGWTKTVRPPARYTTRLKRKQMAELGLSGNPKQFEEDHRVPLELGGHPTDPRNLSPEPWRAPFGAHQKDRLENAIHRDVCSGQLSLHAAQRIFLGNYWVEYKRRYKK